MVCPLKFSPKGGGGEQDSDTDKIINDKIAMKTRIE